MLLPDFFQLPMIGRSCKYGYNLIAVLIGLSKLGHRYAVTQTIKLLEILHQFFMPRVLFPNAITEKLLGGGDALVHRGIIDLEKGGLCQA
jgi:hypothetical protein